MSGLFFSGSGAALLAPADVVPLLAKPYHWRVGRSAYETAHAWFAAMGLPPSVRALLDSAPEYRGARLVRGTFEKQTVLDNLGRPSQTDVLAELALADGPAIVAVEAKVDETFGPTVAEWLEGGSAGKRARLAGLCARLGLDPATVGHLRYQLFHRSAAALIEAEAAGARHAALVVHSFSPVAAGFADFAAFAGALGAPVEGQGRLSAPLALGHIAFRLGWAADKPAAIMEDAI